MQVALAEAKDILVPLDGTEASLEALALACRLARRRKGNVYATYVIEVDRSLPVDAELATETGMAETVLGWARAVAKRGDYHVTADVLQCRDRAQAIISEAAERKVDAIIMGMEYERPFGEFQMPRTVMQVLKQAPCHVWVCRRAAGE